MPRLLLPLALALVGVAGLAVLNYFVAVELLRLEQGEEVFARLSRSVEPIETPLTFSVGGMEPDHPSVRRFSESVGLSGAVRRSLPTTHSQSIDLAWILGANPYPPTLDELRGTLPPHLSFGYLGKDGDFHQVTFFGGEADTTPSVLVPKVRGEKTGHGDFFVRYVFQLKRPGSAAESASPESVDIMDVDWSSYAGGSYNGFEEVGFTVVATAAETAFLVLVVLGTLWARRRGWSPRQPR